MTAKQLAREFFLGIRQAMSCPDVSVAEYEDVMATKIEAAMKAVRDSVIEDLKKRLNESIEKRWELLNKLDAIRKLEAGGTSTAVHENVMACTHEWVDPSNERVDANGYEMCLKCGLLRTRPGAIPDMANMIGTPIVCDASGNVVAPICKSTAVPVIIIPARREQ